MDRQQNECGLDRGSGRCLSMEFGFQRVKGNRRVNGPSQVRDGLQQLNAKSQRPVPKKASVL